MYNITEEWSFSSTSNNNIGINGIGNTTNPNDDKLEGFLSDTTAYIIQTVVEVGLLLEVVLAGVVMNAINMAVFLRQGLSDRINLCLFSLAISDTGYTLFLLTPRFQHLIKLIDPQLGQYLRARTVSLIGVLAGFMITSNCLTLLISLERCLLVISPLKAKTMLSTRHMAVIIVITFCVCLSCSFPYSLKYDLITVTDPTTNHIKYKPVYTPFYVNNKGVIEGFFLTFKIIVPTIVFVGVAIATSVIAVRMRAVTAWREKSANTTTSSERKESSITKMLFVICVMYTICNVPAVISPFLALMIPGLDAGLRYQNTFFVSATLMQLMVGINSSFNMVVYYVMSTRFRDTLKELFTLCKTKNTTVAKSFAKPSD